MSATNKAYDFIVIGGGSGGIACARLAAQHGVDVLLIESRKLGGTCVNVGCVPKKVMWSASYINEKITLAEDYGFSIKTPGFDWKKLKQNRDQYILRLNAIYQHNLDKAKVTVIHGHGQFIDHNTVEVGDHIFTSKHILIATGGEPSVPNINGAQFAITSDGFFELEEQPNRILVIGAGYIATELAGLMNGLGSDVTMLLRKDKLLRLFDHDIHEFVMKQMLSDGVKIHTNVNLVGLHKDPNERLSYETKTGDIVGKFDCVIWAIGRQTKIQNLQLQQTDIQVDEHGYIEVDDYQNTSVSGIYAVGDVTPKVQLTPVAIAAGRQLAERLFNQKPQAKLDYSSIPTVVFSHPPVGTVGLSEAQAIAEYGAQNIKIYTSQFVNMLFALGASKPKTLVKLIVTKGKEEILGCHVAGEGADEMIQGFAVAIKMGATKQDFDNTIAIHPTAAEELVTLR